MVQHGTGCATTLRRAGQWLYNTLAHTTSSGGCDKGLTRLPCCATKRFMGCGSGTRGCLGAGDDILPVGWQGKLPG